VRPPRLIVTVAVVDVPNTHGATLTAPSGLTGSTILRPGPGTGPGSTRPRRRRRHRARARGPPRRHG